MLSSQSIFCCIVVSWWQYTSISCFHLVFHWVSRLIHLTKIDIIYWLVTSWSINEFEKSDCLYQFSTVHLRIETKKTNKGLQSYFLQFHSQQVSVKITRRSIKIVNHQYSSKAIQYNTTQRKTIHYNTIQLQCKTMQYHPCHAIQYNIMQCTMQCDTIQCSAM